MTQTTAPAEYHATTDPHVRCLEQVVPVALGLLCAGVDLAGGNVAAATVAFGIAMLVEEQ